MNEPLTSQPLSSQMATPQIPVIGAPVFQSSWGWHNLSYDDYILVKYLSRRYWEAIRKFARHVRWSRKLPHNRVIRKYIKNAQGQRCGSIIVAPSPEPKLCPVFRDGYSWYWSDALNRRVVAVRPDHWIVRVYAESGPYESPTLVPPLVWPVESIRKLHREFFPKDS